MLSAETFTIVFDLEETLVHVSKDVKNASFLLPIRKVGPKREEQFTNVRSSK